MKTASATSALVLNRAKPKMQITRIHRDIMTGSFENIRGTLT